MILGSLSILSLAMTDSGLLISCNYLELNSGEEIQVTSGTGRITEVMVDTDMLCRSMLQLWPTGLLNWNMARLSTACKMKLHKERLSQIIVINIVIGLGWWVLLLF